MYFNTLSGVILYFISKQVNRCKYRKMEYLIQHFKFRIHLLYSSITGLIV